MRQILLAGSAGFCYGVRRAVELAEEKAAQATKAELEQAGQDCETLKRNARGRLEEAAQLIVGRVVER